jgi:ATP-binding cassette, subfamily B, bacterial
MSKFRDLLYLSRCYVKDGFRSLSFLWSAAPKETFFVTLFIVLQGLLPAASISISKLVVDRAATSLTESGELGLLSIGILVTGWVGALLLEVILPQWIQALQGNLNDKLTAHLSLLLMNKANSFLDLSRFEDSKFYDELQILQQQLKYQPFKLLQSLAEGGRSFITLSTMIVLIAPLGAWIPLLVIFAIIPQAIVSLQYEMQIWLTLFEKSPESRRMQYSTSVLLTDTYAKEVRLFQLGSFFVHQYLSAFRSLHRSMRRLRMQQALWTSGLALMSTIGNGSAFYWVVRQAFRGRISPGSILLFLEALANLQRNLEGLLRMLLNLYETMLYMQQLFKFLDSKPPMQLCFPGLLATNPMRSGITFTNVHFYYADHRPALTNVSFTISPGEIVAIVGENGAGKTTLIKLLLRMYDPVQGKILVDGVDLKELNLEEWRQQIAGAFQDFGRYALTLGENIALGDLKTLEHPEELKYAIQKAGIGTLVEKLAEKENTLLGKQFGGTELSGGEWQKLALARAFARRNAQLLILDEPTAALDPRSEYEVYQRFTELAQGKTTLLVTHRLASVRMANRILVMKEGYLVETGSHEELLNCDGEYAALWNMQAKQYEG